MHGRQRQRQACGWWWCPACQTAAPTRQLTLTRPQARSTGASNATTVAYQIETDICICVCATNQRAQLSMVMQGVWRYCRPCTTSCLSAMACRPLQVRMLTADVSSWSGVRFDECCECADTLAHGVVPIEPPWRLKVLLLDTEPCTKDHAWLVKHALQAACVIALH